MSKCRMVTIDGDNVANWAEHISEVCGRPPPSKDVLAEYRALGSCGIPQSIIDNAVAPENERDAMTLARQYTGSRLGYANTHLQQTAEELGQAAVDASNEVEGVQIEEESDGERHRLVCCSDLC